MEALIKVVGVVVIGYMLFALAQVLWALWDLYRKDRDDQID